MVGIACCTALLLKPGSSIGWVAVDVACLCCVASVPKCIFHLSTAIKKMNIKWSFLHLEGDMMTIRYPSLACHLFLWVIRSVSFILPSISILKCWTATLSSVYVGIPVDYLPAGLTSNCFANLRSHQKCPTLRYQNG